LTPHLRGVIPLLSDNPTGIVEWGNKMAILRGRQRAWAIVVLLSFAVILPACYTRSFVNNSDVSSQASADRDRWLKEEPWNITFDASPEPGKPPSAGDDTYGHFQENPFQWTEHQPRTAFSIAAETTSIGTLRKMLSDGKLPPRDAVRVGDIINSLDYTYPAPTSPHSVGLSLEVGPCPWNEKHRIVRIALKATQFNPERRPDGRVAAADARQPETGDIRGR
jgi:hypothetical protein